MPAYSTLVSGDKFFPYKENLNAVHPDHGDAQFFIPKHNCHTSITLWERNFWKKNEIDDNFPYTLGEDSLRLYQLAKYDLLSEELQFEALMFNFHKVYPPGEKGSPELSEKGLNSFDEKYVQKTRRLIKANSMMVRDAFGIPIKISKKLIDLHRQLQSNVLYYLQHKNNDELECMNLPPYSDVFDLVSNENDLITNHKKVPKLFPCDENTVRRVWWKEFKKLRGGERFEKFGLKKYEFVKKKNAEYEESLYEEVDE